MLKKLLVPSTDVDKRFFYLMLASMLVTFVGGGMDGRSHVYFGFEIESFFIPSHYLLYSGWIMSSLSVLYIAWPQIRKWNFQASRFPAGFISAALGAFLFGLAGPLDYAWHNLAGFEFDLEVLVSPSHLVLFMAIFFIYHSLVIQCVRLYESDPGKYQDSFLSSLPMIIGLGCVFSLIFWPTWYFDPLAADYASGGTFISVRAPYVFIEYGTRITEVIGVAGIILSTLFIIPLVVAPLYRYRLPSGSVLFVLTWVFLERSIILGVYQYLPAALGAGLVAEIIWFWMKRGGARRLASPLGYALMGFCIPFTMYTLYFLIVALTTDGILWPASLWVGSIWMAGLTGVLISVGLVPGQALQARLRGEPALE